MQQGAGQSQPALLATGEGAAAFPQPLRQTGFRVCHQPLQPHLLQHLE